jgi:hypothetical protein
MERNMSKNNQLNKMENKKQFVAILEFTSGEFKAMDISACPRDMEVEEYIETVGDFSMKNSQFITLHQEPEINWMDITTERDDRREEKHYYVLIANAETKEITGLDLSGVKLTKDLDEYLIEDLGFSLENSIYMGMEEEPELIWIERTSEMKTILYPRCCSVTNQGMHEGWMIGDDYAATEEAANQLVKSYGYNSIEEAHESDDDTFYWTNWEADSITEQGYGYTKDGEEIYLDEVEWEPWNCEETESTSIEPLLDKGEDRFTFKLIHLDDKDSNLDKEISH